MDIEDSLGRIESTGSLATQNGRFFNVRIMKRNGKKLNECDVDFGPNEGLESVLPWNHTVFLRTWGCSHNNSDSEYMAGLLGQAGFKVTADKQASDVWLLNSCTVKTPSETQLENQVREALAHSKKVVVAGCVSQASPNEPWLKGVSIVGVQQIDKIVYVVEETLKGNAVRLLSRKKQAPQMDLSFPKIRRNEFIEILAINSGCLNQCTYCKTKAARGDLRSFSLDSLVAQAIRVLTEDGCRELWLTSEDLGAWGRDIGHTIPDLLNALVEVIPDGCMMRLGMTNPPYILDHLKEVAEILCHPRVYSFLHIPVQSGSDAVLSDMKREYSKEHFCRIVDYMTANVPNVYIATDFICAFPTETEEDFEESLELVRRYQFPSVFINQFYPRPGTPAARLKKINTVEARRRTAEMTRLFHSYRRYTDERVGEEHWVLVCEKASDGSNFVGHNKCYEHILVPNPKVQSDDQSLLGKWVHVRIIAVSKFYLRSEIISVENRMNGKELIGKTNDDDHQKKGKLADKNSHLIRCVIVFVVLALALMLRFLSSNRLMFEGYHNDL